MPNENHMYMDDNYKKHEIFGLTWSMNELVDDNWKQMNFLDETSSWLSVCMEIIPKKL